MNIFKKKTFKCFVCDKKTLIEHSIEVEYGFEGHRKGSVRLCLPCFKPIESACIDFTEVENEADSV